MHLFSSVLLLLCQLSNRNAKKLSSFDFSDMRIFKPFSFPTHYICMFAQDVSSVLGESPAALLTKSTYFRSSYSNRVILPQMGLHSSYLKA